MDPTAIGTLLTGGGVLTTLVVVIVYQLSGNRADRQQAQAAIADAENRADAAEAREQLAREAWEQRERDLQARLDAEREARRRAEDQHAEVMREVRQLKAQVAALQAQLGQLRAEVITDDA